jgi:hypothetical protein
MIAAFMTCPVKRVLFIWAIDPWSSTKTYLLDENGLK